jgi:cytochrome P450
MSTTLKAPPGPRGHWLTGNLPQFRRDRLGFLTECARRYGDYVSLRLGPKRVRLLNHPDLIEEVLVTKNRYFIKHFALRQARRALGNGLLTSEGDFWRDQRKLAQPAFQRERISSYAGTMVAFTERMLRDWADGQTRDVQADMMRLTLEIVAKALFDADVSSETMSAHSAMETLLRCFTARVDRIVKLPDYIPTPTNVRMERAAKQLDRILYQIIEKRRASQEHPGDLLSRLLDAQDDESGRRMTNHQLRDEAMTLFLAGHETTANTLAWSWYLLALNPNVESRLHAELDSVLGGRPPTLDDLPKLEYADWVVTEALRVFPTVWIIGREATEPCTIGGYNVPQGTTMYMSQWVLHRDPRFFEDPETFRPERWANGFAKRIPRYAYFPFGGGPRICIGNTFAQMEAVLLLATIASRFRLSLVPGTVVRPVPTMTLRPAGGIPVAVHAR